MTGKKCMYDKIEKLEMGVLEAVKAIAIVVTNLKVSMISSSHSSTYRHTKNAGSIPLSPSPVRVVIAGPPPARKISSAFPPARNNQATEMFNLQRINPPQRQASLQGTIPIHSNHHEQFWKPGRAIGEYEAVAVSFLSPSFKISG
jgi:hypothetical protein